MQTNRLEIWYNSICKQIYFCLLYTSLPSAGWYSFDTSRAPEAVYEYSGFGRVQSAAGIKSKEEWDKHISSNGFDFTAVKDRSYPYSLDYSAECKSMQVEQTVNCYLDWVDRELVDCNQLLQKYNGCLLYTSREIFGGIYRLKYNRSCSIIFTIWERGRSGSKDSKSAFAM